MVSPPYLDKGHQTGLIWDVQKLCKAENNCQTSTRVCQFGVFNSKHKKMQAKVLLISFSGYWSERHWTLFQRMWGSIQVSFSRKEFHFKLTAIPSQRKGSFVFRGGSSFFHQDEGKGQHCNLFSSLVIST